MHISFIIFNIFVLVVIVVAAYALGRRISKETKQNAPEALNNTPYDDCIKENEAKFKYGTFTDARDGETYRTIQIGNQVWMAENLRFKTDGSYAPNNDESNVAKFGRLYTWTKALDIPDEYAEQSTAKDIEMHNRIKDKNYKGIAPEGWHIPSNKEWEQLLSNLDAKSDGGELRAKFMWKNKGKDTFGFFALPAGYRFDNGNFCHFSRRARFWSKDEYGKANAFRLSITNNSVDIEGVYRSDALSIRCVKNV